MKTNIRLPLSCVLKSIAFICLLAQIVLTAPLSSAAFVSSRSADNWTTSSYQSSYSLTVSASAVTTGSTITVNWTAPSGHASNDWVGLYKVGSSDNSYLWWQYTGTATSGSFNVTVPNQVDRYEFRYFTNGGYTRVAVSPSFIANLAGYSVSASPTTVTAGGQLTINWSAPSGRPITDWISVALVGSGNTTGAYWQYTNGTTSGNVTIVGPSQAGQYEIRYYQQDGYTKAAISNAFTVEASAGRFAGLITQGGSGSSISGALVEALQNNVVKGTYVTSSTGAYSFPVSSVGSYDLRVSTSGYPAVTRTGLMIISGNTTTVNVELSNNGSISGIVTRSGDGFPVMGAQVKVKQGAATIKTSSTTATGNYNVSDLQPGTYTVEVSSSGFNTQTQNGVVVSTGNTTPANFSLNATNAGNGINYVYDESGRLVAVIDTSGEVAKYSYDAVGNLLSVTRTNSSSLSILEITPDSGPIGTTVTIYGTGFSATPNQNTIAFNGASATVLAASTTQLITTVPTGATTGPVSITTPLGNVTSGTNFTVIEDTTGAPTITGFSPSIGLPGTAVTITGTNFQTEVTDNNVNFNRTPTGITSVTSTSINTSVPNVGSGKITVTTPYGMATSASDFFVPPAPYTPADVRFAERTYVGTTISVNVPEANKVGLAIFDGTAGQRVIFGLNGIAIDYDISIYRPDGRLQLKQRIAALSGNSGYIDTQTLPLTGAYTILVDPVNTSVGSISIRIYDVPPDIFRIVTLNSSTTVSINNPGQNALFQFQASAGDKVIIRTLDNTSSGSVSLKHLNSLGYEQPIIGSSSYLSAVEPAIHADGTTLTYTGTYDLEINPTGLNTGPVTVEIWKVPPDQTLGITLNQSKLLNFPTIETAQCGNTFCEISVRGRNYWLEFNGTAGQRLSLHVTNNTVGSTYISMNKPDGTYLMGRTNFTGSSYFVEPAILPVNGTYKIFVDPSGTNTGQMTLTLYDAPDITGAITVGGPAVTVTPNVPGQSTALTFSGAAGQQVTVRITGNTLSTIYVTLRKPDGTDMTTVGSSGSSFNLSTQTLPVTGTYTVYVDPTAATMGSANINITNP
jgi:YD repeat-containing protein